MAVLCGLKVKIGLRSNGEADHPNFNVLQCVMDSGVNWSKYVDMPQNGDGHGWHYDKTCGHKEHSDDSPIGMQWAMLIINETFCKQAVAAFPDLCSYMNESECQLFLEEKCTAHLPDAKRDVDALNGRLAEISLLEKIIEKEKDLVLKAAHEERLQACIIEAKNSIDPKTMLPGVRKTDGKTWSDIKSKSAFQFKDLK